MGTCPHPIGLHLSRRYLVEPRSSDVGIKLYSVRPLSISSSAMSCALNLYPGRLYCYTALYQKIVTSVVIVSKLLIPSLQCTLHFPTTRRTIFGEKIRVQYNR